MQFLLIIALCVAVVAVIFAMQNPGPVTVAFLVWQVEGSLALVLLLTFVLGFLTSLCVSLPAMLKRRGAIRAYERKIRELEQKATEPTDAR